MMNFDENILKETLSEMKEKAKIRFLNSQKEHYLGFIKILDSYNISEKGREEILNLILSYGEKNYNFIKNEAKRLLEEGAFIDGK